MVELGFESLLVFDGLHAEDTLGFALPFLPGIGYAGILGRILDAHGLRLAHFFALDIQTKGTEGNLMRIGNQGGILHSFGEEVFTSSTGETIYHSEIAFAYATGIDLEVFLGAEGHIVLVVLGRFVIGSGIHAEEAEIAGMARPHPVVGIATKLTYRAGRSTHQAYIGINLIDKEEILVAVIDGLDMSHKVLVATHGLFDNLLRVLFHQSNALFFGHLRLVALQHLVGYIDHVFQEGYGKPRIRKFFGTRHSPEAILQIVVLYGAMRLDLSVAAMMVGDEQTFGRDEFAGTSTSKTHYGILERRLVDTIDIFGRELEALTLYILYLLEDFGRKPHTFVGTHLISSHQQKC